MMSLLDQFLSEARDSLRGISSLLLRLEQDPTDVGATQELFRLVHTLKGNSGLFDFPEMTRVLHASEDLLDSFRHGQTTYSSALADQLLDAMDFVGNLLSELEQSGTLSSAPAAAAVALSAALRALIGRHEDGPKAPALSPNPTPEPVVESAVVLPAELPTLLSTLLPAVTPAVTPAVRPASAAVVGLPIPPNAQVLATTPESARMEAFRRAQNGLPLHWLHYRPDEQCFFNGDDPLLQALGTPELLWIAIQPRAPWPNLGEMDAYRCVLDFHLLTTATDDALAQHFRYMPETVSIHPLLALNLIIPQGDTRGGPIEEGFITDGLALLDAHDLEGLKKAVQTFLDLCSPSLWIFSALSWLSVLLELNPPDEALLRVMLESLRTLTPPVWPDASTPRDGAGVSDSEFTGSDRTGSNNIASDPRTDPEAATKATDSTIAWDQRAPVQATALRSARAPSDADAGGALPTADSPSSDSRSGVTGPSPGAPPTAAESTKYGRRAEDQPGSRTLKVDQVRIDRLMNLIGEMVVAKNALPYLAMRAENQYGVRELSREIKAQFGVINRIAEEMQDAIMQVRMMPVSFVFQRFPRLVRDLSHRLGKEVRLQLQGEETEADKNIVEALADPLVHLVRNSLDHGLESPAVRLAAGKPPSGTLTIRAAQESDRVVIEIHDDGKGIDPVHVKQKALQKGLIDEDTAATLSDVDAIQLVFEPGFSTAEAISDLSGRGVGLDVVRTTVTKVNGTLQLESVVGKGTLIRIALPLSMAVTKVMIVEADGQSFGIPMDAVVETVRVASTAIHAIKQQQVAVLRNRIVPLNALSHLLGLSADPKRNVDNECAVLVIRKGSETAGLIVDEFRETVDVIQKPMQGFLSGLSAYSGSALMGDGSVLMVLNVKELV